ncbi:MAG TPA: IS256 family transposase [Ktedonobacteraceae bacterium]|nr:IS256 family transposase [Ktedonobacteraceae bacterium]
MTIRPELLDELLKDYQTPQDLFGENGILKQLTQGMIERCLQAEMQEHLGYPKHGRKKPESANTRNGAGQKTRKCEHGELEITVPRDRDGSFEPVLVKKRQTRLEGLEEKILALYARGMTTRDIQAQLQELYGVEVSPTFISNVTEAVMEEVRQWQNRPLEALYPILYVDCLVVKVRENQRVSNKAVYLVLGVTMEGQKELLGMWMSEHEGAKFWLAVFTELHNRGMKDCFIACVDGLTGLPEAIETAFPQTRVQLCMVHLVRNSLKYVSYKHRKAVAADLRAIYGTATEAEFNLELLAEKWDQQYPTISKSWRAQWARVIPLFAFSEDIRKVIYTTNAIESVNMTLRKVTRNHRIFPSDEAVYKVLYLAIQNIAKKWTMPIREWKPALNRFAIEFAGRLPQ